MGRTKGSRNVTTKDRDVRTALKAVFKGEFAAHCWQRYYDAFVSASDWTAESLATVEPDEVGACAGLLEAQLRRFQYVDYARKAAARLLQAADAEQGDGANVAAGSISTQGGVMVAQD